MSAELIVVPHVLGREGAGMGAGPLALAEEAASAVGADRVVRIGLSEPFGNEVAACFDLNRQVAGAVAAARERGALPVVLTGNCLTQQAVVAGLGSPPPALVWLDAHADFHTPETTESGFLDGGALSMTVGDCWTALCATVPGFSPVPARQILLVGVRDVEAAERERLEASELRELPAGEVGELASRWPPGDRVSLHLDLDVLDPAHGRANAFAVGPGIAPDELADVVVTAAARGLAAVTVSAYDPAFDAGGGVREAALAALRRAR